MLLESAEKMFQALALVDVIIGLENYRSSEGNESRAFVGVCSFQKHSFYCNK
jgi:hypothetical protein